MASLSGANYYNGGWTSSSWYTGNNYGWPGLGSGKYIVLKITAATASESMSGRFRIQLPVYCASTVSSYPVRCAVTTTAPSFSSAPSAPSSYTSWNLSVKASYTAQVVYTPTTTIKSGGTYYVWIWSTSRTVAYHGHHSSTGYISAVGIVAPTVTLGTYKGFYSGTSLSVDKSSYGYAYACTTSSGTFWRKITSGTSITVDADTSTTSSKSFYIFRADSDLGSSVYYNGGVYGSLAVPRFACAVYDGSSSYTIKSGNSGTITCSKSGYTFKGLTTSATSTSASSVSYSSSSNGKVYYAVYTQSKSITYYRGSSSSYSASGTRYLYGKGTYGSWSLSEPTKTCASNRNYSFVYWYNNGWTKAYSTLADAINAGYTTVYGYYKKTGSSTNSTVYYYRGSSTKNSVTKTTTIADAYYYGTGSHTGGGTTYSYGTITSTCASDSGASLVGWTASSSSTSSSYSTASAAFDAGQTTIYGIFKKSGSSSNSTVYYYRGSSTKNSVTKTTKVADKYYYGAGSTSGGGTTYSYGTITSTCASDSSASLVGWTTSSSSTTKSYDTATAAFNAGQTTIYGIFKKAGSSSNSTVYYYAGSSTKNSVTKTTAVADKYYYGAGSTSGGGTTYSYGTITTAVSGWTFIGFTTSLTTTSSSSTAKSLFDAGNTTIYGTYSKSETMTYYPQNGESSGTASVTNYLYGTGQKTTNRPDIPTLSKTNCKLSGWGTSSTDTTADAWATLWDAGTRTVYAIWVTNNSIYYGLNGVWKTANVYYGVNGEWKPAVIRYGVNGVWK